MTNIRKYPQTVWIVAAIGLFASCQNAMERRISAHQDAWSKLSGHDRSRLKHEQLRAGDTEEMVLIALGPPDKVVPTTSVNGQKQTLWLYDLLIEEGGSYQHDYNPDAPTHFSDREQYVVFQNGNVVEHWVADDRNIPARMLKSRAEVSAEYMVTRLDALLNLTPEQKVNARDIFLKANEELDHFTREERGPEGVPIRKKMRADIRAILTAAQQKKYDAASPNGGGGSTKKP